MSLSPGPLKIRCVEGLMYVKYVVDKSFRWFKCLCIKQSTLDFSSYFGRSSQATSRIGWLKPDIKKRSDIGRATEDRGCISLVAKVSNRGRLVKNLSPVPLKTHRVGKDAR
ncbi:hypothetical protein TNCV_3507381 [Trichonephila clavipes]|uniref:Uncharacterized protein n=1 Tax=Trichonephila clavipes TaxID=2585209 RepID=A0A8X6VCH5_TRICX|nr:hypothetical protein TNCV_3507381 [Trichonephila clavipes]